MSRIPPEIMTMPDESFPIKHLSSCFDGTCSTVFPLHWHPHWELFELISEKMQVRIGENNFLMQSGDIAVIGGGTWHAGIPLAPEDVHIHTLIFHPELLRAVHQDPCETGFIQPLIRNSIVFSPIIRQDKTLSNLRQTLAQELQDKIAGYQPAVKGLLFQIVSHLYRHYRENELDEAQLRLRMLNGNRLQKVFDFMELKIETHLSVSELAQTAGMSTSHFSRMFSEMTGKPPLQYFTEMKLEKAESFLALGCGTVTEAAQAAGFSDLNYFSRLFKQKRGRLPSQVLSANSKGKF